MIRLFALESSRTGYLLDFGLYGASILALATDLGLHTRGSWSSSVALALLGALSWTLVEYLVHRHVLHGLQPFKRWHEVHHRRPQALLGTPTIFSAALILAFVFVPAVLLGSERTACALTTGFLLGYFAYGVVHHATHHWRAGSDWLLERKRWHALHHHGRFPGRYGVTSGFWDRVFGTSQGQQPASE